MTAFALVLAGLLLRGYATAQAAGSADRERDVLVEAAPTVSIHVLDAGTPTSRPTLVLIPGWTFSASIWSEQIRAFSRERRVVAVDPRSQGRSTKIAEGDTPEQRGRDLQSVTQQLRLRPMVIVAWSQGVQDAAAFVAQFGTAGVRGIVLVDAAVSPGAAAMVRAPENAARQFARLDSYVSDPPAYLRGMLRAVIQRPLSDAELGRLVAEAMQTPPAIGTAMLVADLFGADRTGALARFDCPTLVIASAASPELAAERAMAASLPHGRIELVQHAAHAVFVDQPERFDALLRQFLTGLE
jgi:non-heme chloroperoxidase